MRDFFKTLLLGIALFTTQQVFAEGYKLVVIPDNVTAIGSSAFFSCANLTSVKIGNGVKSIGASAFSNCTKLESVVIGAKVQQIGNRAFSGCKALANMSFEGTRSQWNYITKGDYWKSNILATKITCTDGERAL